MRLMLLYSGICGPNRHAKERERLENEQQDGQASQVLRPVDSPNPAPFSQQYMKNPEARVHSNQKSDRKKQNAVANVAQHVMPRFVAKNKKCLVGCRLMDGVVPNHDALGSAYTGHISVDLSRF